MLSSGNVVHNLRRVQWKDPNGAFDWNIRFDEAVERQLFEDPSSILRILEHPDYGEAVPTPEHFVPLLYTAGIAAQEGQAKALVRGYALGSLSMTCYGVGVAVECPVQADGAATIPSEATTTPSRASPLA